MIGVIDWPYNYPLLLLGFFYMTWWSLGIALIVAALSERSEIVQHIWMPVSYIYMPLCGFMFLAEWLPVRIREIALTVDPPLHIYEMIRSGLFGDRMQAFYDISYVSWILAIITVTGLWLMWNVRKHLVFE